MRLWLWRLWSRWSEWSVMCVIGRTKSGRRYEPAISELRTLMNISFKNWWIFPSKWDMSFENVNEDLKSQWRVKKNRNLVSYINRIKEMRHLLDDDMKNELEMKDVPKLVIALDWFELHTGGEKTARDIYNLSKHVKSLFLSSHRPSWHITRLQLQFKCPTKSIPIFNLNVQQNPPQSSNLNVPYNLNVSQNPLKSSTLISPT